MKAGRRITPIPEVCPVIDSVLEPGHGKHDEGGSLSGCVRNCVEAVRQR